MFLLISLLAVVAATAQSPPKPYYNIGDAHNLFEEYVQKHNKVYNSEEYLKRLDIFKHNLERINERNARDPQSEVGINRFTDLTMEERRQYLGFRRFDATSDERAIRLEYPAEAITAPQEFDWREHDAVVHVKDQGRCQSSYVFSAIGNIEGQYAIKHKKLISLSEQLALDCMNPSRLLPSTCMGGWPHDVMQHYLYMAPYYGVASEEEYPNTGKVNQDNCAWNRTTSTVTNVTEFQIIIPKNEETLMQLLYETGPLAVGFDATRLFEYTKGIYIPVEFDCRYEPNHSALLVGYGIENGTMYWTLKNSWGADWGERGYFRLARGMKACHMGLAYTATCTIT
ncbi:procathepsin L-like [Cydia pomonella]|uniref:procathepsin L-like n=1 Tax=Cydia pomonella TaxID=82600 RepID=UPI002ADE0C2B|nr:procathepsin L-like [Cydia pomonella]